MKKKINIKPYRKILLMSSIRIPGLYGIILFSVLAVLLTTVFVFALTDDTGEIYDGRIFSKYSDRKIFSLQSENSEEVWFTGRSGAARYDRQSRSIDILDAPCYYNGAVPLKFFKNEETAFLLYSDGSIYDIRGKHFLLITPPVSVDRKKNYKVFLENTDYRYLGSPKGGALVLNKKTGVYNSPVIQNMVKPAECMKLFYRARREYSRRLFPETNPLLSISDTEGPGFSTLEDKNFYKGITVKSGLEKDKYYSLKDIISDLDVSHSSCALPELNKGKSFFYNTFPSMYQNMQINKISVLEKDLYIASFSGLHVFAENGRQSADDETAEKFRLDSGRNNLEGGVKDFYVTGDYGIAVTGARQLAVNSPRTSSWKPLFYYSKFDGLSKTRFALHEKDSEILVMVSSPNIGLYNIKDRRWASVSPWGDEGISADACLKNGTLYVLSRAGDSSSVFSSPVDELYRALVENEDIDEIIELTSTVPLAGMIHRDPPLFIGRDGSIRDRKGKVFLGGNNILEESEVRPSPASIRDAFPVKDTLCLFTRQGHLLSYDLVDRSLTQRDRDLISHARNYFEIGIKKDAGSRESKERLVVFYKTDKNAPAEYTEKEGIKDFTVDSTGMSLLNGRYFKKLVPPEEDSEDSTGQAAVSIRYQPVSGKKVKTPLFCRSGQSLFLFNAESRGLFRYDEKSLSWDEVAYEIREAGDPLNIDAVRHIYGDKKGNIYILMKARLGKEKFHSLVLKINTPGRTASFLYKGNSIEPFSEDIVKVTETSNTVFILTGTNDLFAFFKKTGYWQKVRRGDVKDFINSDELLVCRTGNLKGFVYKTGSEKITFFESIDSVTDLKCIVGPRLTYAAENNIAAIDFSLPKGNRKLYTGLIRGNSLDHLSVSAPSGSEERLWHVKGGGSSFYFYDLFNGNIFDCSRVLPAKGKQRYFDAGAFVYRLEGNSTIRPFYFGESKVQVLDPVTADKGTPIAFLSSLNKSETGYITRSVDKGENQYLNIYLDFIDSIYVSPNASLPLLSLSDREWKEGEVLLFKRFFKINEFDDDRYNGVLLLPGRMIPFNAETFQVYMDSESTLIDGYSSRAAGNISLVSNDKIFYREGRYYYINDHGLLEIHQGVLTGGFISKFILSARGRAASGDESEKERLRQVYSFLNKNISSLYFSYYRGRPLISSGDKGLVMTEGRKEYRFTWFDSGLSLQPVNTAALKSASSHGTWIFSVPSGNKFSSREIISKGEDFKFAEDTIHDAVPASSGAVFKTPRGYNEVLLNSTSRRKTDRKNFTASRNYEKKLRKRMVDSFKKKWFTGGNFINTAYINYFSPASGGISYVKKNTSLEDTLVTQMKDSKGQVVIEIVNTRHEGRSVSKIHSDYTPVPWKNNRFFKDDTNNMSFAGGRLVAVFPGHNGMPQYMFPDYKKSSFYPLPGYMQAPLLSRLKGRKYYKHQEQIFWIDDQMKQHVADDHLVSLFENDEYLLSFKKNVAADRVVLHCAGREVSSPFRDNRFFLDYISGGGAYNGEEGGKIVFFNDTVIQTGVMEGGAFKLTGLYNCSGREEKPLIKNGNLYLSSGKKARSLMSIDSKKLSWESVSRELSSIEPSPLINILFSKGTGMPRIERTTGTWGAAVPYLINGKKPGSRLVKGRFFFDNCDGLSPLSQHGDKKVFTYYSGEYALSCVFTDSEDEIDITTIKPKEGSIPAGFVPSGGFVSVPPPWQNVRYGRVTDIFAAKEGFLFCRVSGSKKSYARISLNEGSVNLIMRNSVSFSPSEKNELKGAPGNGWFLKNNRIFFRKEAAK